jgi:hypothetical protein
MFSISDPLFYIQASPKPNLLLALAALGHDLLFTHQPSDPLCPHFGCQGVCRRAQPARFLACCRSGCGRGETGTTGAKSRAESANPQPCFRSPDYTDQTLHSDHPRKQVMPANRANLKFASVREGEIFAPGCKAAHEQVQRTVSTTSPETHLTADGRNCQTPFLPIAHGHRPSHTRAKSRSILPSRYTPGPPKPYHHHHHQEQQENGKPSATSPSGPHSRWIVARGNPPPTQPA